MSDHHAQLKRLTIRNIKAMEDKLPRADEAPYTAVYDILLEHAQDAAGKTDLKATVAVPHMVYGWMPTILDVDMEIINPLSFWNHAGSTKLNENLELSLLEATRKTIKQTGVRKGRNRYEGAIRR